MQNLLASRSVDKERVSVYPSNRTQPVLECQMSGHSQICVLVVKVPPIVIDAGSIAIVALRSLAKKCLPEIGETFVSLISQCAVSPDPATLETRIQVEAP